MLSNLQSGWKKGSGCETKEEILICGGLENRILALKTHLCAWKIVKFHFLAPGAGF